MDTAMDTCLIMVRGGGDLGSGVAHRLHRAGFPVLITELPEPLVIRRMVAFASAVFEGQMQVEGVSARLASSPQQARTLLGQELIPVLVDPDGLAIPALCPQVVVDARMAKRNLDTRIDHAPIVIGLGPGFFAGRDVHAVIETARGHNLGRVLLYGAAEPDSGVPGQMQGFGLERVLRAPCAGIFRSRRRIGDVLEAGQVVADVSGNAVVGSIAGVVRGMLHDGVHVHEAQKVGDIDPRGVVDHCFTISDKARAVGGGVLEAVMYLRHGHRLEGTKDGR